MWLALQPYSLVQAIAIKSDCPFMWSERSLLSSIRKGEICSHQAQMSLNRLMFQPKCRDQTPPKEIRIEPFKGGIWEMKRVSYTSWVKVDLSRRQQIDLRSDAFALARDRGWLFKQMFRRIFEEIRISSSHTSAYLLEYRVFEFSWAGYGSFH